MAIVYHYFITLHEIMRIYSPLSLGINRPPKPMVAPRKLKLQSTERQTRNQRSSQFSLNINRWREVPTGISSTIMCVMYKFIHLYANVYNCPFKLKTIVRNFQPFELISLKFNYRARFNNFQHHPLTNCYFFAFGIFSLYPVVRHVAWAAVYVQ